MQRTEMIEIEIEMREGRGEKMRSEKLSSSNKECATKSSNDYLILPGVQEFIFL